MSAASIFLSLLHPCNLPIHHYFGQSRLTFLQSLSDNTHQTGNNHKKMTQIDDIYGFSFSQPSPSLSAPHLFSPLIQTQWRWSTRRPLVRWHCSRSSGTWSPPPVIPSTSRPTLPTGPANHQTVSPRALMGRVSRNRNADPWNIHLRSTTHYETCVYAYCRSLLICILYVVVSEKNHLLIFSIVV